MYKSIKILLCILICFVTTPLISLRPTQAEEIVYVSRVCDFSKSIEAINNERYHWPDSQGNAGHAVDLNDECNGDKIYAGISGTLYTYEETFFCDEPSINAEVTNTVMEIVNENGTKIVYRHQKDYRVTSGHVDPPTHLASIGQQGCATGPHIHLEVYKNGNKLAYSQWQFVESFIPENVCGATMPTVILHDLTQTIDLRCLSAGKLYAYNYLIKSNVNVEMVTGDRVTLQSGFHAEYGSSLHIFKPQRESNPDTLPK